MIEEFLKLNMNLKGTAREENILKEPVPSFLFKYKTIDIVDGSNILSILVMPDYLSIGTDNEFLRIPMAPLTAQTIADRYDCSLPTKLLSKIIWQNAKNKLAPKPWGPPYDHTMSDTYRYGIHNQTINRQLIGKSPFALTAGHKKDIVLSNQLTGKTVGIYGWFQSDGTPMI